jgi:glutamate mutase epsilon subunit
VTWAEFREAFHAHFISEGIMLRKLEEFLALKQGDQSVMQNVGKFNHLSQYAADQVNSDRKKASLFYERFEFKDLNHDD